MYGKWKREACYTVNMKYLENLKKILNDFKWHRKLWEYFSFSDQEII